MYCVSICFDFSKEYASLIAGYIDGNSTLDTADYFLQSPLRSDSLLPGNALKQTGTTHVSVIGPDSDFVAATMLVAAFLCLLLILMIEIIATSTTGTMDPEGSACNSCNSWPLYAR